VQVIKQNLKDCTELHDINTQLVHSMKTLEDRFVDLEQKCGPAAAIDVEKGASATTGRSSVCIHARIHEHTSHLIAMAICELRCCVTLLTRHVHVLSYALQASANLARRVKPAVVGGIRTDASAPAAAGAAGH